MSMWKQKEVQKMSPWKRVGIAAVIGIALICSSSAYAKGKPDSPGNSGNAPGQSGGSPGKPDSPGKSAEAPGQIQRLAQEIRVDAPGQLSKVENERYDSLEDFLNLDEVRLNSGLARVIIANSEDHEKLRTEMEIIVLAYNLGLITKEDAELRTKKCLDKMGAVTEPGKFLGFMFRCRGALCK